MAYIFSILLYVLTIYHSVLLLLMGRQPWIQWNTGLIGDGSEFQGYYVIFFILFFFKNNVVEMVHKMSTLHIHICGPDRIQAFLSWML